MPCMYIYCMLSLKTWTILILIHLYVSMIYNISVLSSHQNKEFQKIMSNIFQYEVGSDYIYTIIEWLLRREPCFFFKSVHMFHLWRKLIQLPINQNI